MKEAIIVPITCVDCGAILDYMDINQVPENIHPNFKKREPVVIPCKKCGGGVIFIITDAQFDRVVGK